MNEKLWMVVLAGGEGKRLSPLTRALYGDDRPKQFAVLTGDRSLLQQTVERALLLVPAERVLVVVTAHQEALARPQLARYPGVELVIQPRNLDTAPGMLLPLARIRARDPDARVAFLPSDHHVDDAGPILAAIRASAQASTASRILLLGVTPEHPEDDYGWITHGRLVDSAIYEVGRFVEKPSSELASQLEQQGALWNTFISVGPVEMYWGLARAYLPTHARLFERYTRHVGGSDESVVLTEIYATMPRANFSHDVLSRARGLAVTAIAGTGWSDWGSPRRVFSSLLGKPDHAALVSRIASAVQPINFERLLARTTQAATECDG